MNKIVSIEEEATFNIGRNSYEGYVITLFDGNTIQVGIENHQDCCEQWGYLHSEDELTDFVGSEVLSVEVVDAALSTTKVPELYEGSVMFVNINTSAGKFQLVAYNDHNGYYSHEGVVVQNGSVTHKEYL